MAASLKFCAGENFVINDLAGSGLGFYGANFGDSVGVGLYPSRTFITDSTGATQGAEVDNVKYINSGSGILGSAGSGIPLLAVPNYLATVNIRFTNDTACRTQNVKARIYDRSNINNDPSGVTCKVARIIHPGLTQVSNGSGDATWQTPHGSAVVLTLVSSPGTSGYSPSGTATVDTQHDWFLAISPSPDSIGAKAQFGLYCELEYL